MSMDKSIHKQVTNYLTVMLMLLKTEKLFFTTLGSINSFNLWMTEYKCHFCDTLITYQKKPNAFVTSIISHVTGCTHRILQYRKETEGTNISDFEFDDFYCSLSIISTFVKDNFTFVEAKGSSKILCNVCCWQSEPFSEKIGKVLKILLLHLQSNHYASLAKPADYNTSTKESNKPGNSVVHSTKHFNCHPNNFTYTSVNDKAENITTINSVVVFTNEKFELHGDQGQISTCTSKSPTSKSTSDNSVVLNLPNENRKSAEQMFSEENDPPPFVLNQQHCKLNLDYKTATVKNKILSYLDELLNGIALKKSFFTTVGRISGFSKSLDQYKCHLCNKVITRPKQPTKFISSIVNHYTAGCCKSVKENKEDVEEPKNDDLEFSTIYSSFVATRTSINKSFKSLKAVDGAKTVHCKTCSWRSNLKGPQKAIKKLLIHLHQHETEENIKSLPINSEMKKSCLVLDCEHATSIGSPISLDHTNKITDHKVRSATHSQESVEPADHNTNTKESSTTGNSVVSYRDSIGQKTKPHPEVKNTVEETVLEYLNEFLNMIETHKGFFTTVGRIDGFSSNMIQYRCHLCHRTLLADNLSASRFMETIIEHVESCKDQKSENENEGTVDDTCVSESELVSVYQSMLNSRTLLTESFIVFDKRENIGKVFCACILCDWEYWSGWRRGVVNIIQCLTTHLQTKHHNCYPSHFTYNSPDGKTEITDVNSDVEFINGKFEHQGDKGLRSCTSNLGGDLPHEVDKIVEERVVEYARELVYLIQKNKKFFTKIGKKDGFFINITQYQCHLCHSMILAGNEKPDRFIAMILEHVQQCRYKRSIVKDKVVVHDFSNMSQFLLTSTKSLKETFVFLKEDENTNKVCCYCKKCSWQQSLVYGKNVGSIVHILLNHLKTEHFSMSKERSSVEEECSSELKDELNDGENESLNYDRNLKSGSKFNQDSNVEDPGRFEEIKVVTSTDIFNYLDELFETIKIEEEFFLTLGRLSCFSEDLCQYQCHLCPRVISTKKRSSRFISKIMSHVKKCHIGKSKGKVSNSTATDKFETIFNLMCTKSKLVKESFEYVDHEIAGSVFSCKECIWKYTTGCEKKVWKVIKILFHHICNDHNSITDLDLLKDDVTDYLDELLKTFQENKTKNFLTKEGLIHGFGLNLTRYQCHLCSAVIDLGKEAPRTFLKIMKAHVKNCKSGNCKKNHDNMKDSLTKESDFNQFYNTMFRLSNLVKDSLQFLEVKEGDCKMFVCRRSGWESHLKFRDVSDINKFINQMLLHLKTKNFFILSDLQGYETYKKSEAATDHYNSISSVLDYVYKNFECSAEIYESCKSCWVFAGKGNMFTCLRCQMTAILPLHVMRFRNFVVSHHNFHMKCEDRTNPLASPGNAFSCKQKSHDKSVNPKAHITEKPKVEGDVILHNMFQKVSELSLALLASKSCWVVGNTPDETYFSCTCKLKISFKTIHPNEVTNFLVYHFIGPDHVKQYGTVSRPLIVSNNQKNCLIELQATVKVMGFDEMYSSLDQNDRLIKLSQNCFANKQDGNLTHCISCDVDIEYGLNDIESRYLVWDHINSITHKEHFPHLQEDLDRLKTDLSKVLKAKARELLARVQICPGSNFVKCGICQSAVSMRFYALKNHVEDHTTKEVYEITTNDSKYFDNLIFRLKKTLPEVMTSDLKFINKGSVVGYVTCSLCCCAMMSSATYVESHLYELEHIVNRGGVWYE